MTRPVGTGVAPARSRTVNRRLELVKDYLAGPRTAKRREGAAAELGVTPGQFLRLARVWRETGRPERLHGAGTQREDRKPARALRPEVEQTIAVALDRLGADVPFSTLLAEVERRCNATGLPKPAGSTVYARLNRRRTVTGGATSHDASVTIVRCSLRFPVANGDGVARPNALLAVLMPEGLVVGAELGLDGIREPDLPRLVRRLARRSDPDGPVLPILVQRSAMPGQAATAAVEGVALTAASGCMAIISRVFGQRLGYIAIRTRSVSDRTFIERAEARLNAPLTMTEAAGQLLRAIEAHNAGRAAPPSAFRLPEA